MDDRDNLAEPFEESRTHLRAVAYRMLGSATEADDAVQEAWLRLSRTDTTGVENLRGWLTTVVARVCLDMLRSRQSRREEPFTPSSPGHDGVVDPAQETGLADSIGPALLVVLDALGPAERLAFVLHDMFGVSFDEIAPIVGRSPAAARQLASRARRRVQGTTLPEPDLSRQQQIVDAFIAASRGGDFEKLLALLAPDMVVRSDPAAIRMGAAAEIRGAQTVAAFLKGRAGGARPAVVDGFAGAVWLVGGTPRVVFDFTIADGKVVEIELVGDPERLRRMDVQVPQESASAPPG